MALNLSSLALNLSILSAVCFGVALVTGRIGLRALDARSGAAISIPAATVLFVVAAPFALDITAFDFRGAMLFAAVGLFFPAVVTILTTPVNVGCGNPGSRRLREAPRSGLRPQAS